MTEFWNFWIKNVKCVWFPIICHNLDLLCLVMVGSDCLRNVNVSESWENNRVASHWSRKECDTVHLWSSIAPYWVCGRDPYNYSCKKNCIDHLCLLVENMEYQVLFSAHASCCICWSVSYTITAKMVQKYSKKKSRGCEF
jgi:hypothetical protein